MYLQNRAVGSEASGSDHRTRDITPVDVTGETSKALCRVLRDGVDVHRCLAAQALGRIDQPDAVAALIEALLDEDEDVRTDAAAALARRAPAAAGKQLLENLLGDPCSGVKLHAIEALVRMRHPEIAPWLRRMVGGQDEEIAWDDSEFYESGWQDWLDIQVKAIQALAELGVEDAVPEIVSAMDDEFGQDLMEVGCKALAKLGTPGIEALVRYLKDRDVRRRRRVAAVLGSLDAEAARPAIAHALRDRSKDVRLAVAAALASRDPADDRLVPLFADKDPDVRLEAVRLCGNRHPTCLEGLLQDKSPAVLAAVLEILAAAPALLPRDLIVEQACARLRGRDPKLAASAAMVLAAAAPDIAVDELAAQLQDATRPPEVRQGAAKALGKLGGEQAVEALTGVLGSDHRQVRLEAIAALVSLAAVGSPWPNAPGQVLLAALGGDLIPGPVVTEEDRAEEPIAAPPEEDTATDTEFPQSTLQAILGDEEAAQAIPNIAGEPVELTQEDLDRLALVAQTPRKRTLPVTPQVAPHLDVRRLAARVLGDLPRADVALALAESLADADTELRLAAADSLVRVGEAMTEPADPAVGDALLRALGDNERGARLAAIRGLGTLGGPGAADVLREHLHDEDSFIRVEAVRALARLDRVGPEIQDLLQDDDSSVRLNAARAVAGTGDTDAIDALVDFGFASEGQHRREAGRLLRDLGAAAASARFLEVLDDPGRLRVWPVAIEALEEIVQVEQSTTQPIQPEGARPL